MSEVLCCPSDDNVMELIKKFLSACLCIRDGNPFPSQPPFHPRRKMFEKVLSLKYGCLATN